MSIARDKFYNIFKTAHSLTSDDLSNIHNYISELELEKSELIEFVKRIKYAESLFIFMSESDKERFNKILQKTEVIICHQKQ